MPLKKTKFKIKGEEVEFELEEKDILFCRLLEELIHSLRMNNMRKHK